LEVMRQEMMSAKGEYSLATEEIRELKEENEELKEENEELKHDLEIENALLHRAVLGTHREIVTGRGAPRAEEDRKEIMAKMKTRDWLKAWQHGNDAGDGYAVGKATQSPDKAAKAEGWQILDRDKTGNVLTKQPNGTITVIADLYGPWAVDVSADREGSMVERLADRILHPHRREQTGSLRYPRSKWDKLQQKPFDWATPAVIHGPPDSYEFDKDGEFIPEPWRVAHKDIALNWLKKLFRHPDLYTDHESDKFRGKNQIWVGLRDNRDKQAHHTRLLLMHDALKKAGWPVRYGGNGKFLLLVDDIERDALVQSSPRH